MSEDMIFEMAVNASKAKAFDVIADQNVKLQKENNRLKKIIDTYLCDCDDCEGSGKIKHSAVYVNGDLYQDSEIMDCDCCKGTGKQPK